MRAAALLLLLAACRPSSELPPDECPCAESSDARTGGAVVVRWRVLDAQVGRLFSRGQCCCAPQELGGTPAGAQCGESGSACPNTPAWFIPQVRLLVRPLGAGTGVGGRGACYISSGCGDAELTTGFCLSEGEYELKLVAPLGTLVRDGDLGAEVFAVGTARARTPPGVRRVARPGQIVNLDAIVLGVNEPSP